MSDGSKAIKLKNSSRNGLTPLFSTKPKAIDYLMRGQESKETVKDYINLSR